jgi:predicted nucleic acid-binding protein
MFRIFLDTNVAMDLIANRDPFVKDSLPFLTLVEEGKAKLFVSEVSVGTLIYMCIGISARSQIKTIYDTNLVNSLGWCFLVKNSQNHEYHQFCQSSRYRRDRSFQTRKAAKFI